MYTHLNLGICGWMPTITQNNIMNIISSSATALGVPVFVSILNRRVIQLGKRKMFLGVLFSFLEAFTAAFIDSLYMPCRYSNILSLRSKTSISN